MERTFFRTGQPFAHPADEFPGDRASRHSYRAGDDFDVFLAGIDISVLERLRRVAFFGRHELAAELHPVGAEFHDPVDVFAGIESSGGDHRDAAAVELFEMPRFGDHFRNDVFQRVVGVVDLVVFIAEVTARFRTFDDDGVGQVVVVRFPFFADDLRRAGRRDDGHQFRGALPL